MSCTGKTKLTCGGKQFANCVKYEGVLPDWTNLDECADLKETTNELYEAVSDVKNILDLSNLELTCIVQPQNKSLETILTAMIEKVCTLSDTVESQAQTISEMQQQIADLQQNNCP